MTEKPVCREIVRRKQPEGVTFPMDRRLGAGIRGALLSVLVAMSLGGADETPAREVQVLTSDGKKVASPGIGTSPQSLIFKDPEGNEITVRTSASKDGLITLQRGKDGEIVTVGVDGKNRNRLTIKREGSERTDETYLNLAKGGAILVALLVLWWIIRALGRGMKVVEAQEAMRRTRRSWSGSGTEDVYLVD